MIRHEAREKTENEGAEDNSFFYRIHGDWIEVVAAVILAIATVASAWSAYQSSRWGGVEARNFSYANAKRILAAEKADIAEQDYALDVELFVAYSHAMHRGEREYMEYLENVLFRDEMKVAVEAWMTNDPMNNPNAPETPFDLPEYKSASKEKSQALQLEADGNQELATAAIEQSDLYVLFTVMFASVLFFAGISTKFKSPGIRISILAMGALVFLVSFILLCLQKVH